MRKLSVSLIIVVLASIVGIGWLLNEVYISIDAQSQDSKETENYLAVAKDIASVAKNAADTEAFVEQWNQSSRIQLMLIDRDDFPLPEALQGTLNSDKGLMLESDEGISAHFSLPASNRILSISLPYVQSQGETQQLKIILTFCFYAGITTIILMWVWPLIHRLVALRNVAHSFGRGDLSARVRVQRFSYIRDIETEFNRMADRIQSLISDNKLLSRAVSHDLKTPLARLRFGLDALTETQDTKLRDKYAIRVNRDLEEMESLVETLLQYARLDENRVQMMKDTIDLAQLVRPLIQVFDSEAVSVRLDLKSRNTSIFADKRYITMLVNNLLSNAVRHAEQRVLVCMEAKKGQIVLSVEDDGQGIPDEERENAIKPFWRGAPGRGEKGHGMGLAIVARIAEWHGASLAVGESKLLMGAAISLTFKSGH